MKAILIIVAVFVLLALLVPLIEKATGGKPSPSYPKLAKWILPLVFLTLVVKMLYVWIHG
ncbi:hypothetical protein NI389_05880 [Pseudoalteromonas xiamenensis]|uniref:hypothetical protein n=1 Tax=Pseudoalteromonas xiamenensis TaxID=882626 RepID=UPI0027E5071B|nr:hypothetical protein [Pseudoalteromonas xiamenensis]WMN60925.1 hypothetical protein NI389_05880 [Pseudoalteromonas xiamenensis]